MPADANLILQAVVTKIAAFNGAGLDLKVGTPARGLMVRVIFSAANTSAGAGTATLRVTSGIDNATFGRILGQPAETTLVLSTTAQAGTVFIPITTPDRYVRLELSAITGTNGTITYQADIVAAGYRP